MSVENFLAKIPLTNISTNDDIQRVFETDNSELERVAQSRIQKVNMLDEDEIKKYTEEYSPYPFFLYGYLNKASDMKIIAMPFANGKKWVDDRSCVLFKVDDSWEVTFKFNRELHTQYINAIKNWSIKWSGNTKTENQRIPQDGQWRFYIFDSNKNVEKIVGLRLAFAPQHVKDSRNIPLETCVIRFSDQEGRKRLEDSGFNIYDLEKLKKLEELKKGLIIISGPTGSGKSSTLFGFLDKVNDWTRSIYTLENPVEYDVPGISQFDIQPIEDIPDNDEVTNNFTRSESFLMRWAPDIILVWESRSYQTAKSSVVFANTWHIAFTTLHTNSSIQSLDRLFGFKSKDGDKLDKFNTIESLEYISAQMLSPRLCPHCKIKVKELRQRLNTWDIELDKRNQALINDVDAQKPLIKQEMKRSNIKVILGEKFCSDPVLEQLIEESYLPNLTGCEHCSWRKQKVDPNTWNVILVPTRRTGFKGRLLLNETILFDNYIKTMLSDGKTNNQVLKHLLNERPLIPQGTIWALNPEQPERVFLTMYQDALIKALAPSNFIEKLVPSLGKSNGIISVLDAKKFGYSEV